MIERLNLKKKVNDVVDFLNQEIKGKDNSTFYYTENNRRVFAKQEHEVKQLYRDTIDNYVEYNDKQDIKGLALIWRGQSGDMKRFYVKLCISDERNADNLLKILLWNTNKELFVKLDKDSSLFKIFTRKGFKFFHGRGREILLRRPKYVYNFDNSRDKGTESDRGFSPKQRRR